MTRFSQGESNLLLPLRFPFLSLPQFPFSPAVSGRRDEGCHLPAYVLTEIVCACLV